MGLVSEMKNLSEELLASFKNRIRENEELVTEVKNTLDGFQKDHREMTAVLNANAAALRKGLANGEKERMSSFKSLMTGIHRSITSINKEVKAIQTSTFNMINDFAAGREEMAAELNKTFAQERAGRKQDEKERMKEFDALMKDINADIKNINDEVLSIFKNTNDMLDRFEKEHLDMSAELRADLGKNLAERVEYTRSLLNGFQKRLSEISKENQKMAQNLRKELANGETKRIGNYNELMKGINLSIKDIRKDVKAIQKSTAGMLGDLFNNRVQASEMWDKMQETMAQIRKTGVASQPKEAARKIEKKEPKMNFPFESIKEEVVVKAQPKAEIKPEPKVELKPVPKPVAPMTLEEKILDYLDKHPKGVKISEMEEPLGEIRMKLGFAAKNLLNEGKVQKKENIYFPIKLK